MKAVLKTFEEKYVPKKEPVKPVPKTEPDCRSAISLNLVQHKHLYVIVVVTLQVGSNTSSETR